MHFKLLLITLLLITTLACQKVEHTCIYEQKIYSLLKVEQEIVEAKDAIITNINYLNEHNLTGKKLIGQKAGPLANISNCWNLIDGAYLESIMISDEHLIFFEYLKHSCSWDEEYIVYNDKEEDFSPKVFADAIVRQDLIGIDWFQVSVKNSACRIDRDYVNANIGEHNMQVDQDILELGTSYLSGDYLPSGWSYDVDMIALKIGTIQKENQSMLLYAFIEKELKKVHSLKIATVINGELRYNYPVWIYSESPEDYSIIRKDSTGYLVEAFINNELFYCYYPENGKLVSKRLGDQ